MMKISKSLFLILFMTIMVLAACSRSAAPPTSAPLMPTAAVQVVPAVAIPTANLLPTAMPTIPPPIMPTPEPGAVVYDFIQNACQAAWFNSGQYLPCPGDLNYKQAGYIGVVETTALENGLEMSVSSLLTIPAQESFYTGISGRFPPITIQSGDRFKTGLGCMPSPQGDCDPEYALEYYDNIGGYHELPGAENLGLVAQSEPGSSLLLVDIPLDELAGQTVELVLVIRDKGEPLGDNALWISPYIWRDPDLIASSTPEDQQDASSPGAVPDYTPGVISGKIDMGNAPEHLRNDYGWSAPVVVVFFNLDDYTYWYNQTIYTHPEYQMTIPPGRYHVAAYAYSVDQQPYITAAYTGMNPSCNEPLKEVVMPPNGQLNGIIIADWNWNCEGSAERPEKPYQVPIP